MEVASGQQRRAAIFVALIAAALVIGYGTLFVLRLHPIAAGILILLGALLIWLAPRLVSFRDYERGVFFRFGKFLRVAGPGPVITFPSIESYVRVDLRENRIDLPPQPVITQDNISITVDVVCMVKVTDPKKAVLNVKDYQHALSDLLYAEIRNAVSELPLQSVLDRTDDIRKVMLDHTTPTAESWGVKIVRVEIERILLPDELRLAFNARREAEEKKARIQVEAEARQVMLNLLNESASQLSPATMEYLYLDTLKRMAEGRATKFILPAELSRLAEVVGARLLTRPNPVSEATK